MKNIALKVLILEDLLPDLELMVEQLSEAGFQLDVTHTDTEITFREALQIKKYDIILSDFRLPGFDAFGALEICKEFCPEVPFICISGSIGEEAAVELLKMGAVDYVMKDRPGKLPYTVKRALEDAEKKKEHHKAVRLLKESEEKFRNIFYNNAAIKLIIDHENGNIVEANEAAANFYGYAIKTLQKMNISQINIFPEEKLNDKSINNGNINQKHIEFRHFKADGTQVDVEVFSSRIKIGNKAYHHFIIHDISEKKKAEENLQLLNRAIESSSVSVIITDEKGDIIYTNPFFTQVTGYSQEESIGKKPRMLKSGYHSKEFYQKLWDTLYGGNNWEGEFRNRKKNGELFWEKAIISPIFNSYGAVTNYIAIKEDITFKKQAEETRQQLEIAQRTARFRQDFLAKMSHEIRTPLTGVLGMIEVLEQTKLSRNQSDFVNTIKTSGENLREIINQVLEYSKIEAGKISLHPVDFEFKTLLENTKELFKDNLNVGVELTIEIDPQIPPFIRADKSRLSQIVNNLVSNSIKFTNEGSVALKAELDKVGETDNQLFIKIFVFDTGIGISESLQDKLFNPFVQSEEGERSIYEGTGLGLSICKELVELMQGEIGLKSKKGEGSTFWFNFSAEKTENVLPVQEKISVRKSSKKLRILLAEDRLFLQKITKLLLNSMGHEVQMANHGQQAIEIFKPGQFDLILMDINMPIMDGITATRILKEKYSNMPPIVGLSANAFEGDSEKYISLGLDDYLTKPFDSEKLSSIIMKYFE